MMDWFEKITGFKELGYDETRALLHVADGRLRSRHSARSYTVGTLEMPSLAELRERTAPLLARDVGPTKVSCISGDVRRLHAAPENEGALFQVASQFNLLEMVSEAVTPEHGVTRYAFDQTQGPACAIAAGAATIYRNYFVPVGEGIGQTRARQIDCLAGLGAALGNRDNGTLWRMENGYALCTSSGIAAIDDRLAASNPQELDQLRGLLRIGLHWDVELTDVAEPGRLVSQAFCSALPVGYSDPNIPPQRWRRFATLVLEATYEATLLGTLLNRERAGCSTVLLTRVGGGAFGNDGRWILAAMERALESVRDAGLDVHIVSYGAPSSEMTGMAARFLR